MQALMSIASEPSPAPTPPRPERPPSSNYISSSVYERQLPEMGLRPPMSIASEPSPAPTPPRPERPPSSNYISSSVYERQLPEMGLRPPCLRRKSAPEHPGNPAPPSFRPPPLPPPVEKRQSLPCYQTEPLYTVIYEGSYIKVLPGDETDDGVDIDHLLRWLKAVEYSDSMTPSMCGLSLQDETREFTQRAMCVKKALHLFNLLRMKRGDALQSHISELLAITNSLGKVQKKTRKMTIAGGTTGAMGGVAMVLGIALAPMTMGLSLIGTAAGAGMVASAGGMGAHAVKLNKKTVDKELVEKTLQHYKADIIDVERCLTFILSGMDELRRHDLSRLRRAWAPPEVLRVAELSQAQGFRDDPRGAMAKYTAHTRLLQAFTREKDLYFTHDGQKLKKGTGDKFFNRVGLLAEDLQKAMEELNHMWETFSRY